MEPAERLIARIKNDYISRTLENWRGYERQFVIELVRGLDEAAFAFIMAPNRQQLIRHDVARHYILLGAAVALRPFLEALSHDDGRVPWAPTSPARSALADQHLGNCGRLAAVERIAALERYGLTKATFVRSDRLLLEVVSSQDDDAELSAGAWLGNFERQKLADTQKRLAAMKSSIAAQIDRYAYVSDGWFIGYDPPQDVLDYHHDYAAVFSAGTAEADALPGEAIIGGRQFSSWNAVSQTALGRTLHHMACATRLRATTGKLELRNLLTVCARKDAIGPIWRQTGEDEAGAQAIFEALTLDAEVARNLEKDYETPVPYYIDFGKQFVLLPTFGALLNSHAGMVWHLKRKHRSDWDRAVDGREAVFRADLSELFPSTRYAVMERGARLRRPDGSHITDVDAIVLDTILGRVTLVQLKWPDIYGRSISERNSRRLNLLKANDWVGRVHDWIGGRSSKQVAASLGLRSMSETSPAILVIARHIVRFSGEEGYDPRAKWGSWPELMRAHLRWPEKDIVDLPIDRARRSRKAQRSDPAIFQLPGLTVEVRA